MTRRLPSRLFPGDRRVWLPALVLLPVLALASIPSLNGPREPLTGTSGVAPWASVGTIAPRQRACEPVIVPAHTGIIQVWTAAPTTTRATLHGTLTLRGGRRLALRPAALVAPGLTWDLGMAPQPADVPARLCLWADAPLTLVGGAISPLPGQPPLRIAGKPIPGALLTLRYKRDEGTRSLFDLLVHAPPHAAAFRPGPVGAWTYWAMALLVLPGLVYAALRVLATAERRSPRRVAASVAAIAFVFAACWALTTPLFGGPDEPSHWSYEQYLAETGHTPEIAPGSRAPYATEEALLLIAVRQPTSVLLGAVRPAWLSGEERAWHAAQRGAPRDDGGGYNAASSAHSPLYYAALAPAYEAFRGADLVTRMTAVRLLNALLACLVAAAATLAVRELLPRRPMLAAAAGLLVALEPVAAFMGGVVDNDTGVNVAAALTLYLVVRALRRGLTPRLAIGIALGLVALPLAKIVGYGVVPAVVAGLVIAVARLPRRAAVVSGGVAAATFAVATLAWTHVIAPWFSPGQTGTLVNAGSNTTSTLTAFHDPLLTLDYLVQTFFPPIHLTGRNLTYGWPAFEIYIREGFGAFGWETIQFTSLRIYDVICGVVILVVALAGSAAWRGRRRLLRGWPVVLVLTLAALGVFAFVAAAYTSSTPRPVPAEHGRYAFPALVPLAALAAFACLGVGRRHVALVAGALVSLMGGLGLAGWVLAFSGWFT